MEAFLFSLLIGATVSIKCSWQTPSMRLQQEGWLFPTVLWPGIELPSLTECGYFLDQETGIDLTEQMVCSTTKFEGSYHRDARNWFTGQTYQTKWNYESDVKSCNLKAVCNNLAGHTPPHPHISLQKHSNVHTYIRRIHRQHQRLPIRRI